MIPKKKWFLWVVLALSLVLAMASLCACDDEDGEGGGVKKTKAGLSIKVDEDTGKMSIKWPQIGDPVPMGDPDTWTIFVYLCGSDLESRWFFGGMVSGDIKEMCAASASDECGAADKGIIRLRKGDKITPTYYSVDENGEDADEYEGDSYTIKAKKGRLKITYGEMCRGDYAYAFCITDVYGDDYITDAAEFHINKYGEISFYE